VGVTDTHCHLDYLEADELEAALYAARDFRAILTIGTDSVKNRKALEIAEKTPNVWAAVGLHPTEAEMLSPELEADLSELAKHPKVRAIGETGLDFYWKPETRPAQYRALEFQANLAQAHALPLIFHVRSAKTNDTAEVELAEWLLLHRPPRFVLHAFGGHRRLLEVSLELGGYLSFAGSLTYKKNDALRDTAREVPLDRLLVETDSPFLPPEPHRGKRNHPAWVQHTLAKLAEGRGIEVVEMERVTDENAQQLFAF
jgi:TatD DNase family protein